MRFRNWVVGGFDRDRAVGFCRHGVNPLVSVFLASRGTKHIDEVNEILCDVQNEIYDPFLLKDMNKAVFTIREAVDNGQRIVIYGDYDVDGMTSCVILAHWLRSKGADYDIYIPGRFDEGYGLNKAAIDTLHSQGANLIITVDCGITAIEEAEYAKSLGIALVITDHHECRDTFPEADAVIDPKRPDCTYPDKNLAGVGVAFKLICALEADTCPDELFRSYGDLVAIGTIADAMPVLCENRELIRRGLMALNSNPRSGIRMLLRESGAILGKATTSTIGFSLAPRLNAAGRMGQTELSLNLLLSEDDHESETLATQLGNLNAQRRALESMIYDEVVSMLDSAPHKEPIILAKKGWYQGVTGIVAARIAERYRVPAIIISIDDSGMGRGSCRSFGTFAIFDSLRSCADLLTNYGGHEMAAGLSIAQENIDELTHRIKQFYFEKAGSLPAPDLKLDFEVEKPELLTVQNIQALEKLEPFGNGYLSPRLCMKGASVSVTQAIGDGKHTRLKLEKSGKSLDCIFFSMPSEDLGIGVGSVVDAAFEPQVNEFRGRSSVQLHLIDIRPSANN